jgi:hypothetical protein
MVDETGIPSLSVVAGIGSAVGMEAVAALAGHTALTNYRNGDSRWKMAAVVMLLYVVIGLYELGPTIGGSMFIIAAAFYFLIALRNDAVEEKREKFADKADALELKKYQLKLSQELKIAQAEMGAITRVEKLNAKAPKAQKAYPCECGKLFATGQARGAHKRFCGGAK